MISPSKIQKHMDVVSSKSEPLGMVDRRGRRAQAGARRIDEKIHLKRPAQDVESACGPVNPFESREGSRSGGGKPVIREPCLAQRYATALEGLDSLFAQQKGVGARVLAESTVEQAILLHIAHPVRSDDLAHAGPRRDGLLTDRVSRFLHELREGLE